MSEKDAEKAIDGKETDSTEKTPLVPKPEWMDPQTKQLLIIGGLTVLLMVFGMVQVQVIEGWQPLTALYVIVQIVTTIGYGDFTVASEEMKLFCAFYVILMLVFGAYCCNILIGWVQDRAMSMARKKLRHIESKFGGEPVVQEDIDAAQQKKDRNDMILATVLAVSAIVFGTIFYATYEACTCSYGRSYVDGCKEDTYELCIETGGYKKSWTCAFYMSVITLTTVGFGDHSPRSWIGRCVGIVWMLVGVSFMANWFATLSRIFFDFNQKRKLKALTKLSRDEFDKIDVDGNGGLSRAEYRGYFLMQNGLVSKEDLDAIDAHFNRMILQAGGKLKGDTPPQVTWDMVKDSSCCNN